MTRATSRSNAFAPNGDTAFHARVQAGLRRAPRERAMAVRALWTAISKHLW